MSLIRVSHRRLSGIDADQRAQRDGILEVCDDQTRIIDDCEAACGYKMEAPRKTLKKRRSSGRLMQGTYLTQIQIAFPVWTDYALKQSPWDEVDFSRNFHTPAEFGQRLLLAAKYLDKYIWLYSAKPDEGISEHARRDSALMFSEI